MSQAGEVFHSSSDEQQQVTSESHLRAVPDVLALPHSGKTYVNARGETCVSYAHLDFSGIDEELSHQGLPSTEYNRMQCAIERYERKQKENR